MPPAITGRLAVKEGRLRVLKPRKEIEAIQGPLPDDEDNDDEGGIPQIVKELAPRYPRTKSSILLQIFEHSTPWTNGKFGTRKRLGSPKDLGSVKRWSNAFSNISRSFPTLKSMTLFLPYWTFTHRFSSSTNPTNGKQLSFWR